MLALPAIAGKFGVRGGGYTMSNGDAAGDVGPEAGIAEPEPPTRAINMTRLGDAAGRADPPIRAAVRLQLQPGADRPRPARGRAWPGARRSVHRRPRAGPDRHLPLRRRGAAGHRVPRAPRGPARLRRDAPVRFAGGGGRPGRGALQPPAVRCADRRGSGSIAPAIRSPRTSWSRRSSPRARMARRCSASSASTTSRCRRRARGRSVRRRVPGYAGSQDRPGPRAALDAEAKGLYRLREDPATAAYPLALISPAIATQISVVLRPAPHQAGGGRAVDPTTRRRAASPPGRRCGCGTTWAR
jgi:hypothetical protein